MFAGLRNADHVGLKAGAFVLPAVALTLASASRSPDFAKFRAAARGEAVPPLSAIAGKAGDVIWLLS